MIPRGTTYHVGYTTLEAVKSRFDDDPNSSPSFTEGARGIVCCECGPLGVWATEERDSAMAKGKTRPEPPTSGKPVPRAAKDVEPRLARFFSTLETEAEKRFERLVLRLVWRLGLVSRHAIRGLSQRIDQLERRLRVPQAASRRKSAAPARV